MKPCRILDMYDYHTPALDYPRKKIGRAQIVDRFMPKGTYEMYGVNGYKYYKLHQRTRTTNLKIKGKIWMVDEPSHHYAMIAHSDKFHGHVLCAGLGLGLIVHALNDNPRVKKITVIEREQDVIDLVKPHLPQKKLLVILADFWNFVPWSKDKIDCVFYDLFVGNGRNLLPQAMRVWFELHERFPKTIRRIHGFDNEQLASLDRLIEKL